MNNEKLNNYWRLVDLWNKKLRFFNIDKQKAQDQSKALFDFIKTHSNINNFIDIGAGAGSLSLLHSIQNPQATINLLEKNFGRYCFLKYACQDLDLSAIAHHIDVVDFHSTQPSIMVVQAFSNIEKLLSVTAHLNFDIATLKQSNIDQELDQAKKHYSFKYKTLTSPHGQLLLIEKSNNRSS